MKKILILFTAVISLSSFAGSELTVKNADFKVFNPEKSLPQDWRDYSLKDTQITPTDGGGIKIAIMQTAKLDSSLEQEIKNPPGNQKYCFSAKVSSSRSGMAYLMVKIFKGNQELKRFASRDAQRRAGELNVVFDTGDADRLTLHCRTRLDDPGLIGQFATFNDLKLTKVEAVVAHKAEKLELVPGFESCSIYLNNLKAVRPQVAGGQVFYRRQGADIWQKALDLVWVPDELAARSSLLKLTENTGYELKIELVDNGKTETLMGKFRTLSSILPIAETVVIGPDNFEGELVINRSGKPDGYIRYIAQPGFVLKSLEKSEQTVLLEQAEYIILEGLTVRGGRRHGINVVNSNHIRIINCDIGNYGGAGVQDIYQDGKYYQNGRALNNHAGINIGSSGQVVVERSYIHDARGRANSWFYSHPAGPNAIFVHSTGGTVIRYNDFVGSDEHRWNDVIEGCDNGSQTGGFYRDAEVYGNYLAFGNDDGIEFDGGQMNCRFYYNRVEGTLCGVSTAPCLLGPSYIFQNLICKLGDEFGANNTLVKNNYSAYGKGRLYFYNNTMTGAGNAYAGYSNDVPPEYANDLKAVSRNNLFYPEKSLLPGKIFAIPHDFNYDLFWIDAWGKSPKGTEFKQNNQEANGIFAQPEFVNPLAGDYRLKQNSQGWRAGVPVPDVMPVDHPDIGAFQVDGPQILPHRPLKFIPSVNQLEFIWKDSPPAEQTMLVKADSTAESGSFKIVQNESTNFFKVTPDTFTIRPGESVTLKVQLVDSNMPVARLYSGAFLIRRTDGLSRPVSVYADLRNDSKRLELDRQTAIFGKVTTPDTTGTIQIDFEVPQAGDYYLFVRSSAPPYGINLSLDGGIVDMANFYGTVNQASHWYAMVIKAYSNLPNRPFKLSAGKHHFVLTRRKDFNFNIEAAGLAKVPAVFLMSPFK